jgi:voltage-gated potassium channel
VSDLRRREWERRTSRPLVFAALVFLAAYAWPILQPGLPRWADVACRVATVVVWVLFGIDFAVRLALAERRAAFVRSNWLDVLTLVLPFLRPLRVLRVVLALNVLGRRAGAFARGRVVGSVVASVAVVGLIAALAVLDAERGRPGANIETFGDALWWAAVTIATVGYGDRFPITTEGRFVAVGLMATGITMLGVVTAALASWFVEKLSQVEEAEVQTEQGLADLAAELRGLRDEIQSLRASLELDGQPDR